MLPPNPNPRPKLNTKINTKVTEARERIAGVEARTKPIPIWRDTLEIIKKAVLYPLPAAIVAGSITAYNVEKTYNIGMNELAGMSQPEREKRIPELQKIIKEIEDARKRGLADQTVESAKRYIESIRTGRGILDAYRFLQAELKLLQAVKFSEDYLLKLNYISWIITFESLLFSVIFTLLKWTQLRRIRGEILKDEQAMLILQEEERKQNILLSRLMITIIKVNQAMNTLERDKDLSDEKSDFLLKNLQSEVEELLKILPKEYTDLIHAGNENPDSISLETLFQKLGSVHASIVANMEKDLTELSK